jgi:hypothetical protein
MIAIGGEKLLRGIAGGGCGEDSTTSRVALF